MYTNLRRVDVEHLFGALLVAKALMVAGKTGEIADAESRGAQDVALHRDPVPIAADHLHDRLDSGPHEERRHGDAGHPHDGRLIVRDIHRVHRAAEKLRLLVHDLDVRAGRGAELRRDGEMARFEHLFQIAPDFMSSRPPPTPWRIALVAALNERARPLFHPIHRWPQRREHVEPALGFQSVIDHFPGALHPIAHFATSVGACSAARSIEGALRAAHHGANAPGKRESALATASAGLLVIADIPVHTEKHRIESGEHRRRGIGLGAVLHTRAARQREHALDILDALLDVLEELEVALAFDGEAFILVRDARLAGALGEVLGKRKGFSLAAGEAHGCTSPAAHDEHLPIPFHHPEYFFQRFPRGFDHCLPPYDPHTWHSPHVRGPVTLPAAFSLSWQVMQAS